MGWTCTATTKEITLEIPTLVRVYKDGSIERLQGSPFVPPTLEDPKTGVASKDVVISKNPSISARMYLPNKNDLNHNKVPILVYFHGGGFFFESAFSEQHQNYLNMVVSAARVIVVSVEYRLAPETPLPAAYDDCWHALKWVANPNNADPWLMKHGDFDRLFIGGDSAGGNIAHNVGMRAGSEDGVTLSGAIVSHPYFFGSKPVGCEPVSGHEESASARVWEFVCPNGPGGLDNPLINPLGRGAGSLAGLGCSKLLVCTAERDTVGRERAVSYYEALKKSGWHGEAELFEVEGEGHVFHVYDPHTKNAQKMLKRFAAFLLR